MSYLVFAICAWEMVALSTRKIPTITTLVHEHRHETWCVLLVLAGIAWLFWHLLLEARGGS